MTMPPGGWFGEPSKEHTALSMQAAVLRSLGSSFVADVLEAAHRQLHRAPRTAALIDEWPGDTAAAGLAMRFNGALHALARRSGSAGLRALLHRERDDFDGTIGDALAANDLFVAAWMLDPPQTNEVARAGAIMAALMVLRTRFDMPVTLLELGASAGLNLNLAYYGFDLGGRRFGPPGSPVSIAPAWRGAAPPDVAVQIAGARGVDLRPLDVTEAEARERLSSFAWTDDPERAERLHHAIDVARANRPVVDRGDLCDWLPRQLAMPQPAGTCRVMFHSMVIQYLSLADRQRITAAIEAAGALADDACPLASIGFEWTECRSEVRLTLNSWPGGTARHLATCHPYGEWIHWHG